MNQKKSQNKGEMKMGILEWFSSKKKKFYINLPDGSKDVIIFDTFKEAKVWYRANLDKYAKKPRILKGLFKGNKLVQRKLSAENGY
jgi:hypothetical protein